VLYALSEATDEFANPPYVDKIGGGGGRDAMHCVSTIPIATTIAAYTFKNLPSKKK
jgi:hypothetical protein